MCFEKPALASVAFGSCFSSTSCFFVFCQFRNSPEGSTKKLNAQKQLLDVMTHRLHIDNSMELIGKLLFGSEKGSEILKTVRPTGQPLVDNWDCLKTMVGANDLSYMRLHILFDFYLFILYSQSCNIAEMPFVVFDR